MARIVMFLAPRAGPFSPLVGQELPVQRDDYPVAAISWADVSPLPGVHVTIRPATVIVTSGDLP